MPTARPKAAVQINHGMAEHAGCYAEFGAFLSSAGYAAYAHDHRGHGHTEAPGSSLGYVAPRDGWNLVLSDVRAVNCHIRNLHDDVPIVCFGHSMGSIIAFNHILREPGTVVSAALWNSGVEAGFLGLLMGAILRIQRFFLGSDVPSRLAKRVTFEAWNARFAPTRTEADWLSRDNAQVDRYVADPLCGFDVSIGLWLDLLEGIHFAANDRNLAKLPTTMPIHLLAGAEDPCTDRGLAVEHILERMKKCGMQDVTFELLPQCRHNALIELNRLEVMADFVRWLDQRFGEVSQSVKPLHSKPG